MEKTLILFIEQTNIDDKIKYYGKVGRVNTSAKVTPNSKILTKLKYEDCSSIYKITHINNLIRNEIIEKAKQIYYEKQYKEGLILLEEKSSWIIEPEIIKPNNGKYNGKYY